MIIALAIFIGVFAAVPIVCLAVMLGPFALTELRRWLEWRHVARMQRRRRIELGESLLNRRSR